MKMNGFCDFLSKTPVIFNYQTDGKQQTLGSARGKSAAGQASGVPYEKKLKPEECNCLRPLGPSNASPYPRHVQSVLGVLLLFPPPLQPSPHTLDSLCPAVWSPEGMHAVTDNANSPLPQFWAWSSEKQHSARTGLPTSCHSGPQMRVQGSGCPQHGEQQQLPFENLLCARRSKTYLYT